MHGRETRVLLRHYLEQGVSKSELAKRFGISRRTVYHWIETGQLDRDLDSQEVRYRPRPPVVSQLDPYKPIIQARLEAFPLLTGQRLFEELRSAGYPGSYTQLKEYVRRVRPHAPSEPVVRFETPPGYQGQVDFGTFQLPWGRRYALLVVLGYSRLLWMRFYARQTLTTLIRGLESAFEFFGGVPQELLFDQMRFGVGGRAHGRLWADHERRVRALLGTLGLPRSRLPTVSGKNQGQGRATDPLCAAELLLWPHVPER